MHVTTLLRSSSALLILLCSLPAWATWDGQTILTGMPASSLQGTTLSFETGGESVPVTVQGEDDDGNAILLIGFSGDSATAGTLTLDGPNGAQTISTPAAAAGENILIDPATGSARTQAATPTPSLRPLGDDWPKNRVSLNLGVMNVEDTSAAAAGVVIPSGGSEFINVFSPDIEMAGGSVSYQFNSGLSLPTWLDPNSSGNLTFGISYSNYQGDDTNQRTIPSGGDNTGFLYTQDLSGSTGAFAGAGGLVSESKVDADFNRLGLSMSWPLTNNWGNNVRISPVISGGYTSFDYTIMSMDTFDPNLFPTADFMDHRVQKVEQDMLDLGIGARVQKLLGKGGQFDLFTDLAVRAYYNDAKLSSNEDVTISGNLDQIAFNDDDNQTTVGADVGIGAGLNFGNNWRAEVSADYQFNVPVALVNNPTMGDVERAPISLNVDTENRWRAGVSIGYSF